MVANMIFMNHAISLKSILSLAIVALVATAVVPALSVSAAAGESEQKHLGQQKPGLPMEVISVSSDSITTSLTRVPERLTQRHGIEEGDQVTVSITEETKVKIAGEDGDLSHLEEGQNVFVVGKIDFETMTVEAKRISDRHHRPFRIGEVVEIDTDANTILVTNLKEDVGYVLVRYDEETIIRQDLEEVDETAIEVGDKIHVKGEANLDSAEYKAQIDAQSIRLWDELEPRSPRAQRGGNHFPKGSIES